MLTTHRIQEHFESLELERLRSEIEELRSRVAVLQSQLLESRADLQKEWQNPKAVAE